ncbi:hypothetical protein [Campylobacter sp. US33a]|uniref:hypothetical protein n=1 Tax=Campylobacter sp. US33a TaxID=2498120 RepID=UPI00106814FF|nr:hypothetical protein [Campylobacter sp. US33a]TEY00711.1 hypothetical protein ELQ16_08740 [Campylobacter sp. US33a]
MRKILLAICVTSYLFCAEANNPLAPQNFIQPKAIEQNQNKDLNDLKTNEFYLNMDVNDIRNIQSRDKELKDALYQFSQKEINYKPVIRPISSMDTIQLHPYFTHSILLPEGAVISYVDSSVEMAILKYENNMLMLRPKSNFDIANLAIVYKLDEKNQILNILAERYSVRDGEKLNQVITYKNIEKRDPLYVIQAYRMQNGKLPDKKYNYIKIDGIDYRIVEDNQYGNISIENKNYRVDNNVIYK